MIEDEKSASLWQNVAQWNQRNKRYGRDVICNSGGVWSEFGSHVLAPFQQDPRSNGCTYVPSFSVPDLEGMIIDDYAKNGRPGEV